MQSCALTGVCGLALCCWTDPLTTPGVVHGLKKRWKKVANTDVAVLSVRMKQHLPFAHESSTEPTSTTLPKAEQRIAVFHSGLFFQRVCALRRLLRKDDLPGHADRADCS